jgi:hypothetical protein
LRRILYAVLWEPLPIKTHTWRRVGEFLWRLWLLILLCVIVAGLTGWHPIAWAVSFVFLSAMSAYANMQAAMAMARADAPSEAEE